MATNAALAPPANYRLPQGGNFKEDSLASEEIASLKPRKSPFNVNLSSEERQVLLPLTRKYTAPYCDVIRVKIILLADQGLSK
jgi:hypothetical protein